jgi:signal transduction histidine kinase
MQDPAAMDGQADAALTSILLTLGRTVVLDLDARLNVTGAHNPLLLDEWREPALRAGPARPATLRGLLEEIMASARARDLLLQIGEGCRSAGQAGLYLGVAALHAPRGGAPERHVALSLHHRADPEPGATRLVMRDVTALTDVQHSLGETQSALDAAMAALRAPPQGLRMFLGSALTSVSAIRATLRTPARDAEALHDKLARLHAAVAQLDKEAEALNLAPVQDACQALLNRLTALLERDELTGDALLPLATLVDRIAGSAGMLWRIEEQRHVEPAAAGTAARAARQPDWNFATERRWSSFLRHRGEAIGVLVNLEMEGTAHVPRHLRPGIDELLQHMLRNAVEHGIETPEERLAAQKPAAGKVLVKFEQPGKSQLRMSVRDDGRGRGLGLTFLRKAVARLGGQIAVAARPDQYTEFVIDLPQEPQQEPHAAALA